MKAAQDSVDQNLGLRVSDGYLDAFIPHAYIELSRSGYETWYPFDNCKQKAGNLIDKAITLSWQ